MAQELQEVEKLQRLIRQAEVARAALKHDVTALRGRLDIPMRLRASLKFHPGSWLVGSLGLGLIGSMLFRRRPARTEKKVVRGGLFLSLLGLALTAVRPLAKVWVTDQVKNYLMRRPNGYWLNRLTQSPTHPQPPLQ